MNLDAHYANLRESIEEIEQAIKRGVVNRQRTIGFHTSAAAADMYEIILHKKDLITTGFMVKHDWFAAKNKVKAKLHFEFSEREEILPLISAIEMERNKLCYGRPASEETILKVLDLFQRLKKKFADMGYANGL